MSYFVFSSYPSISSSRKQRIFNIWCSLWYWVSGDVCTMHNYMLTSELLLLFLSKLVNYEPEQNFSINHNHFGINQNPSMFIFFLPFCSVTCQQSEVYLFIRHKSGRAGSSDVGSQFHCRRTFCKWDPE